MNAFKIVMQPLLVAALWPFLANSIIYIIGNSYIYASEWDPFINRNIMFLLYTIIIVPIILLIEILIGNRLALIYRVALSTVLSSLFFFFVTRSFKLSGLTHSEWLFAHLGFFIFIIIQAIVVARLTDQARILHQSSP